MMPADPSTGRTAPTVDAAIVPQPQPPGSSIKQRGRREEFIIVLPETTVEAASQTMTRLQRELTKHFFLADNEKVLITFSAGVVPYNTPSTTIGLHWIWERFSGLPSPLR